MDTKAVSQSPHSLFMRQGQWRSLLKAPHPLQCLSADEVGVPDLTGSPAPALACLSGQKPNLLRGPGSDSHSPSVSFLHFLWMQTAMVATLSRDTRDKEGNEAGGHRHKATLIRKGKNLGRDDSLFHGSFKTAPR